MERYEVEVKAWCSDHSKMAELLEKKGAEMTGREEEDDVYFNHPSRDFKKTDEALRIRKAGDKTILTYKGPKLSGQVKSRTELETEVKDFDCMCAVLLSLGFVKSGSVFKTRTVYRLGDTEFCLDFVRDLGSFVEIEKTGQDRGRLEKEVAALAEDFGLENIEKRSYLELVLLKARAPF